VGEAVTGFWRRLTDFVSRGLEPVEREAVLGDLAESTASGAEKLRDVLGLVVRGKRLYGGTGDPGLQ
jgi:hypothetical protein